MTKTRFSFVAAPVPLEGVHSKLVIIVPTEIVAQLPGGRIRVKGKMNDTDFGLAIRHKGSHRYFSLGSGLRREAHLKAGVPIRISFQLVDPDKVDVPEVLQAVLDQDAVAMREWKKISQGLQRGIIHYIMSVKNIDSRIQRSLEMMERAKHGQLYAQSSASKQKSPD